MAESDDECFNIDQSSLKYYDEYTESNKNEYMYNDDGSIYSDKDVVSIQVPIANNTMGQHHVL